MQLAPRAVPYKNSGYHHGSECAEDHANLALESKNKETGTNLPTQAGTPWLVLHDWAALKFRLGSAVVVPVTHHHLFIRSCLNVNLVEPATANAALLHWVFCVFSSFVLGATWKQCIPQTSNFGADGGRLDASFRRSNEFCFSQWSSSLSAQSSYQYQWQRRGLCWLWSEFCSCLLHAVYDYTPSFAKKWCRLFWQNF